MRRAIYNRYTLALSFICRKTSKVNNRRMCDEENTSSNSHRFISMRNKKFLFFHRLIITLSHLTETQIWKLIIINHPFFLAVAVMPHIIISVHDSVERSHRQTLYWTSPECLLIIHHWRRSTVFVLATYCSWSK